MITTVEDIDLLGVALRLHRPREWVQRHWRRLVREEGFPPPFVGGETGRRAYWVAAAVDAWKLRKSGAEPHSTPFKEPQPERRLPAPWSPANDPTAPVITEDSRVAALLAAAGG